MSTLPDEAQKISGNVFDIGILRRMWRFLVPYRWQFFGVVTLTLGLSALVPLRPYLIQHILDVSLVEGDMEGVTRMTIVLFVLLMVQVSLQYFYLFYAGSLGQKVVCDIRVRLYAHVQRLGARFFDKTPIGRLVTRCVSDIEALLNVFSEGLASILGDLLQLVALLILMFVLDWRLTLLSLSPLPFLVLSTYVFKEKIKASFNQVRAAVSRLNTFVQEHITGMYIVQVFGVEASTLSRFKLINAEHRQAYMRSILYYSIYFPIAEVIYAVSIGLVVWYGAGSVIQEQLTLGVLIAFMMYIQMFFRPIRMIADKFNTLQMGIVSAHRVLTLLEYRDAPQSTSNKHLRGRRSDISFEDVYFAYDPPHDVLRGISFYVKEGTHVALVGETGSGKTSLIHLLNRFHDPYRGVVKIDDIDIKGFPLEELRRAVGFVMQDVFLFSGTLRDNITLYDTSISDERIRKVAKQMGAWALISQLPNELDYQVTERGATLSVGERQMLSFLRTMVYDPKILVLDEATSSVDSNTEQLLQEAMRSLMKNRTTLIVAHRLSTIEDADMIIVLDQGTVAEQGTHASLLRKKGIYRKLYEMQYKNQLPKPRVAK